MNNSLNSLKGDYIGDYIGVTKGDTRSLDYNTHQPWTFAASALKPTDPSAPSEAKRRKPLASMISSPALQLRGTSQQREEEEETGGRIAKNRESMLPTVAGSFAEHVVVSDEAQKGISGRMVNSQPIFLNRPHTKSIFCISRFPAQIDNP